MRRALVGAAVVLLVNIASVRLLASGQERSLNLRGAYLEVLGDLLGSVAVIAAGVILLTTGFRLADPIASIAIAVLILPRTWTLLRDVREAANPERLRAVAGDAGCHACHTHLSCTERCPKQISPTAGIAGLKRAAAAAAARAFAREIAVARLPPIRL